MKRCLLVGAAPSNNRGLDFVLKTQNFDAIYAVDGGFTCLNERQIYPNKVFGDFDSLGAIPNHPDIHSFDTHKDFTDMNLAIQDALACDFDELVVCNALEARLDHTLGNLQLLAKTAAKGVKTWGISNEFAIATLFAPGPLSYLHFSQGAQGTCSVFNQSDSAEGVTEEGLEYSITEACTKNTQLWGISNELIGKPASIGLQKGSLWVFFPLKELPKAEYGCQQSH